MLFIDFHCNSDLLKGPPMPCDSELNPMPWQI